MGGNSKVLVYTGNEGLLQVTLNSLKAKTGISIMEISYSMNPFIPKEEADEIRKEFLERNIKVREITNQPFRDDNYTSVKEFDKKCMDYRYVDPKKLKIDVETLIYNNVTAFYTYKDDPFCIEVYSEKLAKMQTQVFGYIWNIAERPIVGKGGRTSLF